MSAPVPDPRGTALRLADLGMLLLDAGVSVSDVRADLDAAAASCGESGVTFSVLPQMIVADHRATGAAVVVTSDGAELTFRQAAHAGRLVHRLRSGRIAPADLADRIAAIRALPRRNPATQWVLGTALTCAGLAVVTRCSWWSVLAATAVAVVVGLLTWACNRVPSAAAVAPFLSALVSTTLIGAISNVLHLGPAPLFAVCAPVAILVPGTIITSSLLELSGSDIITGSSRLMYGVLVLVFMAIGIATGTALTDVRVDPASATVVGEAHRIRDLGAAWQALPPNWFAWVGVLVLGVGVALALGAGVRLMGLTVAVMTATYTLLVLVNPLVGSVAGTGVAAAAMMIAARLVERRSAGVPVAVLFQPALLILVPGTVGLVALASHDPDRILAAPAIFLSLCLGVKIGALLTDPAWSRLRARTWRHRGAGPHPTAPRGTRW